MEGGRLLEVQVWLLEYLAITCGALAPSPFPGVLRRARCIKALCVLYLVPYGNKIEHPPRQSICRNKGVCPQVWFHRRNKTRS